MGASTMTRRQITGIGGQRKRIGERAAALCLLIPVLWKLASAEALAQQVASPINAPTSAISGHALCATSNPQQAVDCGVVPSGNVTVSAPLSSTGGATPTVSLTGPSDLATLVAGVIPKGAGTSPMTASALADNGTIVTSTEPVDVEGNALVTEVANSATGTTLNKLAKLTGAPLAAQVTATGDTTAAGIVVGGGGTSGNAEIAIAGQTTCVFDGATTANDYVQISATTSGDCHDAGATRPTSGRILGFVESTNSSAGTYPVWMFPPGVDGVASGSGCTPSGAAGVVQASNGSGGCEAISITDNGTKVSTTEPISVGTTMTLNNTSSATIDYGVTQSGAVTLDNPGSGTDRFNLFGPSATYVQMNVGTSTSAYATLQWSGGGGVFSTYTNATPFTFEGSMQVFAPAATNTLQLNTSNVVLSSGIGLGWASGTVSGSSATTPDTFLTRGSAATIQLGGANAASPVSQTLGTQGTRPGTDSNASGANLTIQSGIGTGNSTGSTLNLSAPAPTSSGTGAQTQTVQVAINNSGVSVTPKLTANGGVNLPSLSASATVCTDGSQNIITCAYGTLLGVQVFTSSGTYSPDTGTRSVIVEGCGGGASGGGAAASTASNNASVASGGGAGGYFKVRLTSGFSGATVTIGAGGGAPTAGNNNGNAGGNTSFGSAIMGDGGVGGISMADGTGRANIGGAGGIATITSGITIAANQGADGGNLFFTDSIGWSGEGGSSPFGKGGQSAVNANSGSAQSAGNAGQGYCSGGSGAISSDNTSGTAEPGGAGTGGIVIVWEFS